jgi:hypothetical protein
MLAAIKYGFWISQHTLPEIKRALSTDQKRYQTEPPFQKLDFFWDIAISQRISFCQQ